MLRSPAYRPAGPADRILRALASRRRRAILELLRRGPRTTSELAARFSRARLSRFAVMQHLKVLETAGLVITIRRGRQRYHHVDPAPMRRVLEAWLRRFRPLPPAVQRALKYRARQEQLLHGGLDRRGRRATLKERGRARSSTG